MGKKVEIVDAMDAQWPDAVEQSAEQPVDPVIADLAAESIEQAAPAPETPVEGWLVTSAEESVYCCGMTHPKGTRLLPLEFLTDKQVAEVGAHPLLSIERVGA